MLPLNDHDKLNEVLAHIQPTCKRLLESCYMAAQREKLDDGTMLAFLVMQGYLNGAIDTYVAMKGGSDDLDRRIYGTKLLEVLEPVRASIEAKIERIKRQIAKAERSSDRHGNNGA